MKEVSRLIADARSDVMGLAIARKYNLVDRDIRLWGDEKSLQLKNGKRTSVRILGFRHDVLAEGTWAGISFEFADVPITHHMNQGMTNEGGWKASGMRRWINRDFLALLPDDLRPHIAMAVKWTNNVGEVQEGDTDLVTSEHDMLWLLSVSEVYGELSKHPGDAPWSPATYDAEGEQYKLYADKGVTTTHCVFCQKRYGDNQSWWLRSPLAFGTYWFHDVYIDGGWNVVYSNVNIGVSPGFCL